MSSRPSVIASFSPTPSRRNIGVCGSGRYTEFELAFDDTLTIDVFIDYSDIVATVLALFGGLALWFMALAPRLAHLENPNMFIGWVVFLIMLVPSPVLMWINATSDPCQLNWFEPLR